MMSAKLRWIAIVTGSLIACSGVVLSWTDPVPAICLILGAAIQPRSPRTGRWLVWASALSASIGTFPLGFAALRSIINVLRAPEASYILLPTLAFLLPISLLLWCDVGFAIDAATQLHSTSATRMQTSRRSLDWLVWIAAFLMTAWYIRMIVYGVRPLQLHGRLDILAFGATFTTIMLLLDVALVVEAVKSRRTR